MLNIISLKTRKARGGLIFEGPLIGGGGGGGGWAYKRQFPVCNIAAKVRYIHLF